MKKILTSLALIISVASLTFVSRPLFASETDARIETSATQSYVFKTFLKDDGITIQSKDGVATLTGTVADQAHKSLASETVANLPGVISVDNKLEENRESPAVNTDAWLVSKVQSTLLFHRNVNATETEVLAKDGTVTLRGEAANQAQRDLATEYAKDVDGVKKVENEMTVSAAAVKPGEQTMGEKLDALGQKIGTMGEKVGVVVEKIDDASITGLVKTTLLYHRSTSAINTQVQTKDGVVSLGGKARNAAEKDLATQLVSDIHGVKMVINNMTVVGAGATTN